METQIRRYDLLAYAKTLGEEEQSKLTEGIGQISFQPDGTCTYETAVDAIEQLGLAEEFRGFFSQILTYPQQIKSKGVASDAIFWER